MEELRATSRKYASDLVTVGEATKFARDMATAYFEGGYVVPDDADLYWKGI